MSPLDPNVVIAWRASGAIGAAAITAVIAALELILLLPQRIVVLAPGALTGMAAVFAFGLALLWPGLRYRFFGWQVSAEQVVIQKGVIWRSRSLIPRVRIQHVDTRTSPLQRWLGLSTLVIYTAGTHGSDAEIPGLAQGEAEHLREELAKLEELDDRG